MSSSSSNSGSSSGEVSLAAGRAEVLRYCPETNTWVSLDGGLSRVDVCGTPEPRHRIVAVSAFRHTPVLNLPVYSALACTPLSQVFRHLSGVHGDYGLNFATPEEAAAFSRALDAAVAASAAALVAPAPHGCADTLYARIVGTPFAGLPHHPLPSVLPFFSLSLSRTRSHCRVGGRAHTHTDVQLPQEQQQPAEPKRKGSLVTEDALRAQIRARKERRKKKASVRLSRAAAATALSASAPAAQTGLVPTPVDTLRAELRSFAHKEVAAALAVVAGTAPAPS